RLKHGLAAEGESEGFHPPDEPPLAVSQGREWAGQGFLIPLEFWPIWQLMNVYPYALRTRKSAGLMTRKLSVTESQKTAQFFGTSSRRKCSTDWQNSLYVA